MNDEEMIPVNCADAQAKYDERSVRFWILSNNERIPIIGKFRVKLGPTRISIEKFVRFDGVKFTFQYFHLPQEAVDLIRPAPQGTEVDFEIPGLVTHFLPRQ